LVITDQLIDELRTVTARQKLKKYFDQEKVEELVSLLEIISTKIKLDKVEQICRDPKDDFLLALAKQSKADFLVTGDKDLLELKKYHKTQIVTVNQFIKL
jgi:putative PIN family toxin of toxin-antitoxin system